MEEVDTDRLWSIFNLLSDPVSAEDGSSGPVGVIRSAGLISFLTAHNLRPFCEFCK